MPHSHLPHKEPLIFIGEMIELQEKLCRFFVHFPSKPTLAMFCEASAQGSSFFPLFPKRTIGVVSSFRNIKKIGSISETDYALTIRILHTFNNSYLFHFEAYNLSNDQIEASGEISVFYLI